MTIEIDTPSESSESRKRLRLVAWVLSTGVLTSFAAAVAEARDASGFLPTALGLVEWLVCFFVIAMAVEMARERSSRKLFVVALVITATPFVTVALVSLVASGGHDAATFGLLYLTRASVVSGLSLVVLAGMRFVMERRKERSDTNG